MSVGCDFEGCTVGETGVCALERDPTTCDHRTGNEVDAAETAGAPVDQRDAGAIGAPVLSSSETMAAFRSSRTLGPAAISAMMASRYVTVVGILGDPEAGKTACLASLYLLVSNATLAGWKFADSKSLTAFEEIARGAREWATGNPPEQMTVHTELSDDRRPGFLHLRLVREADGRRIDLALPDLPGEWTTELVGVARSDRLEFLKAAEALWIVLDGRALEDKERRQSLIARLGQLAGRLTTMFGGSVPKMMLVITHRDFGEPSAAVRTGLAKELAKRSIEAEVVPVAPFSDDDAVAPAGFGLDALLSATAGTPPSQPEFWSPSAPTEGTRSYISYRRDR